MSKSEGIIEMALDVIHPDMWGYRIKELEGNICISYLEWNEDKKDFVEQGECSQISVIVIDRVMEAMRLLKDNYDKYGD